MIPTLRFRLAKACGIAATCLLAVQPMEASCNSSEHVASLNKLVEAHTEATAETESIEVSDTLYLEELRVIGTRIEVPDHYQPVWIQSVDPTHMSNLPHESAAYLLSGNTFSLVRDYGEGNMALISQRGFPPGHSRILWEEMPINHPMLGVFDLSLIPAGMIDGLSSSSGNPAAMSGSGGIGGTVSLQTRKRDEKAFISHSIGSYGFGQTGAGASITEGHFSGGIRAYLQRGDYDFLYDDPDPVRQQKKTRDNNHKSAGYLLAQSKYKYHDWRFRSLVWLDNITNELPGSVYAPSRARQDDRSYRWLLQTGYDGFERTWITATAGWYRYELDYTDQRTARTDAGTSRLFMIQPVARHVWSHRHESNFAAQWAWQKIETDHYAQTSHHHQVSTRVNHSWQLASFAVLYPSVEWETHTEFQNALNPALGITFLPGTQRLILRGMVSRNRNNPSFNDLYWQPGGNADLQPETVTSYETGFSFRFSANGDEEVVTAGFTLFRNSFEDGIRWIPGPDGRFTPRNMEQIRSRGAELDLRMQREISAIGFDLHYMVSHTRASITKERFQGDGAVGRQMIYVPEWMHKGSFYVAFQERIWTRITLQHIGQRFTTMDHSSPRDPLSAVTRMDTDAGISMAVRSTHIQASIGIRNLTDQSYEIISGYPVAPRHYNASLTVSLR